LDWVSGVHKLSQVVRQMKVRLVIANTVRAALYASVAARLTGVPFIWYMRDFWLSESQPRYARLDRWGKYAIGSAASRIIVNSTAVAQQLPMERQVKVIHNGIDLARYQAEVDSRAFRATWAVPSEAPVVGMVGRLRPWKGHERFLRSMAHVSRQMPDCRYLIVGGTIFNVDRDYPRRLQTLAQELGLAERVIFTGHLDDIRPALGSMDIFVHPGEPEPFGLVNIEAMAMRKPVVAFAHGALPEIVIEGQTGKLVPPGDEVTLSARVIDLLRNPVQRMALGEAGRCRVEAQFSVEHVVSAVTAVFEQVIT
jgi:glycosyltransferase involved in cell wall biosynthesis